MLTEDTYNKLKKLYIGELDITFFEKENIDTGSMDSELLLSIMGSIAESESLSISENNKWSIQRKFKNGTFKCSYPPYGYKKQKKRGCISSNTK